MSGTPAVTAVLHDTPYLVTLSDDLGHTWQADEPIDVGGANAGPMHKLLIGEVRVHTDLR